MNYAVYAIDCPSYDGGLDSDGTVYFGQTSRGVKARMKGHSTPKSRCPHLAAWLRKRASEGHAFRVLVISEGLTKEQADSLESQLIVVARKTHTVLNLTDGGDGAVGYKHSDTTKQLLRSLQTGRKATDATKHKMSLARKGQPRPETSKKLRGRPKSPEHVAKVAASVRAGSHWDARRHEILPLYSSGLTMGQIAELLQCSHNTVWKHIKRLGASRTPHESRKRRHRVDE